MDPNFKKKLVAVLNEDFIMPIISKNYYIKDFTMETYLMEITTFLKTSTNHDKKVV
jgi:hypothetical protein